VVRAKSGRAGLPTIRSDLEIRRGDFTVAAKLETDAKVSGLFGPTGSGKTTILLAMAGLLEPARGRIEVGGTVLYDSNQNIALPPEKRRVGVVFQDGRLFPHLSVRDNLRFSRSGSSSAGPRFDEVVHLLDLEPLLDRRPDALSGGQAGLVAIGRALLYRPRVLLLDEPLTGLDPALRRRVLAYLLRLKNSVDVSVLFVSHVFSDFLALVDEAALMHDGRILAQGSPKELMTQALGETEAGPVETTLSGEIAAVHDSQVEALCSGARFYLSVPGASPGDAVYVTVGAQDVLLGSGAPPRTSARNVLVGRVHEIQRSGSQILVRVDVGPHIWAEITEESRIALEIEAGREVYLLAKASALRGVALSPAVVRQS
jgi:molybdate transport system ATP-binding protein